MSVKLSARARARKNSTRVLIVTNQTSGSGRGNNLFDLLMGRTQFAQVVEPLAKAGKPSEWNIIETTKDGSWKTELGQRVKSASIDALVVIGGDGTLMDVASVLAVSDGECSKRPVVFAVPGGRGNDFIRALYGYTLEEGDFWSWLERGREWRERTIDLASANDRVFLNMASLGYGGRVVENAHNRKAFWSKTPLVYQVEGALALFEGRNTFCEIKADGKNVYSGDFFGGFVGNGQANGSGLFWTRNAAFADGKIDGIVFPKPGVLEMGRTISAVKKRSKPTFSFTEFQGGEIAFRFEEAMALELDGDYVGSSTTCIFRCLTAALKVFAPVV